MYDYGESEQVGLTVPYVVMELVDGASLASRLGRESRLSWREAVTIGAEVSSALATAHARGVVHRDVTRATSCSRRPGSRSSTSASPRWSGRARGPDGALLGTPRTSPGTAGQRPGVPGHRRVRGRAAALPDAHRPAAVAGQDDHQMLRAHMYNEPEPMPSVPGLPDGVADLVGRCLAKRPADRPATAELTRTLAEAAGMLAAVPVSRPAAPGPGHARQCAHHDPALVGGDRRVAVVADPQPGPAGAAAGDPASAGGGRGGGRRVDRGHRRDVGFTSRSPASGGDRPTTEARMVCRPRRPARWRTRCAPTPAASSPPS
ncbi:hypothetical protein NKG94_40020 [Micromonospora sp. M12]